MSPKMIPMTATLRMQNARGREVRLWIPLFLLWILAAPIFLILLPFVLLACLITWINPLRLIGTFGQILSSTRGSEVEIEKHQKKVWIRLN